MKDRHPTRSLIASQGLSGPVLKSEIILGRDCKAIELKEWEDIHDISPDSQPIPRYPKHAKDVQTNMMVLQVVLLNNSLLWNHEKKKQSEGVPMVNTLEINPNDTVNDVQEDIRAMLISKKEYSEHEIRVRIWLPAL